MASMGSPSSSICRRMSMPLPSGSMRSTRATSKSDCLSCSRPSATVSAATAMWPRARSSSQMTSERALSSSTTSMRTELESAMTSAPPRLRSRHRQDQGQPRTLADLALDPDLAPVRGDDAVADGEAEAGALSDRLGGEEGAEDLVQVLRWDAHAVVGDGEHHRVRSVAPRLEIDVPSGRCGVEGVHQE